uniref:Uncharacterized protein n=1 Tax=Manihot esculenta TaxID=3983 RepID=A0A2C9UX37_MANES
MRKWQRKRLGGVLAGTGDSSTFLSFHMVASSIPLPSSKWIYFIEAVSIQIHHGMLPKMHQVSFWTWLVKIC